MQFRMLIATVFCMVDDKDIATSYIFYFIAVIAIIGFLLLGGFLLWLR